MRRLAIVLAVLSTSFLTTGCPPPNVPRVASAESAQSTLELPDLPVPEPGETRLWVMGDAGWAGRTHETSFATLRALHERWPEASTVLVPGDLTYQKGLSTNCRKARERLRADYTDAAPGLTFVATPGNHDHADDEQRDVPEVAARHAYFDCAHQQRAASLTGWDPAHCACLPEWKLPEGVGDVGVRELRAPDEQGPGLVLVTLDSQAALARPEAIANELQGTLADVPSDHRVLLMMHHPLRSCGPHGTSGGSAQDEHHPRYQAYLDAVRPVVEAHASRILLVIAGHDHSLQFFRGRPPELVSGAAAKTSGVTDCRGNVAYGDTPGLVVLDVRTDGSQRLTFVHRGAPHVVELPAAR